MKTIGPALGIGKHILPREAHDRSDVLADGAVSNAPPDLQSAAIGVLSAAIRKAGSTDPGKIREAILSTKGYKGAEGEYNFDQFGDGLHGYNIVRNEKGTVVFDKHIEFTD